MRYNIYNHMLSTRGWKYRAFLRYLRVFKYVAFAPSRGGFLESYYILMRYLDDLVDGDLSLPEGVASESEYIQQKINFMNIGGQPSDDVEALMMYCFHLGKQFNKEFHSETEDILKSLLFDAKRRGKYRIFSKEELDHHFHLLDIRGTIRATLKIFNEDPDKYTFLEPLGIACRYQYDIEDIESDLKAGYVNIPKEECELFGIKEEDLLNANTAGIRKWLNYRANKGLELLAQHNQLVGKANFGWLARATFPLVYASPAKKVFLETLKNN